MTSNPHSRPLGAIEPVSGTTSYTDVIRRPAPPVTREDTYISAMWACDEDFMAAVHEVMAVADAENATLTVEVERLRVKVNLKVLQRDYAVLQRDEVRATLAERDAMIATDDIELQAKDATIAERDAKIERMTYERSHPFGDLIQAADDRRSL